MGARTRRLRARLQGREAGAAAFAIGRAGAINAALLAAACLAGTDNALAGRGIDWRIALTQSRRVSLYLKS